MIRAATVLLPLAALLCMGGCHTAAKARKASPATTLAVDALLPSPRLLIGRVIAIDPVKGMAVVEVVADVPATALQDGTELIARTLDLRETARLQTSRFIRGRILGTKIVGGQPSPGDEVVWLAP